MKKIDKLIYLFSRLPGLGSRTAKRIVLHLVKNKDRLMLPLAESLFETASVMKECSVCGNIDEGDVCSICLDEKRNKSIVCVVESIVDLWALENAGFFRGVYHVLGGTLSSSDNRGPSEIKVDKLLGRVAAEKIEEIIIATNATMEGQTTAFFITEKLKPYGVRVTRFASGIPIGGELDYLDEVTISTAFNQRQIF